MKLLLVTFVLLALAFAGIAIKILLKGGSNKKHYSNFQAKSEIIERGSVHQVGD